MKKLTSILLVLTSMTMTAPVFAGAGHSHDKDGGHSNRAQGPIDAAKAKSKATQTMKNLAKRGVIDQSWTGITAFMAEKKSYTKGEEWVVSFKNDNIKDKAKQTLYIFYSLDGHYIAANYTGK